MVSPFAIRLAITDVETAGAVAGRFYALSTAGSLLGTFVPALIAIPLVGTQRTLLGTAALLALSASFLLGRKVLVLAAALAALVAVPPGAVKAEPGLLHEEDSLYQFIQVVERADGRRLLRLNEGVAVHSVWRRDTVLTGGVWDAFLALPPLLDRPLRSVAILGNAAGTTARALGVFYPEARVDGVELDPAVSRVGRRWFGLDDNPRLTVHDADARPFLRRTDERYDLIVVDAYHQPYVPFYLATREFFRLARERLAPGGILALNVASVPGDESLLDGIAGHADARVRRRWRSGRRCASTRSCSPSTAPPRLADVRERCATALRARRCGSCCARDLRPVTEQGEAPVDGRPRARRVGDRPDDRRVRRAGRRARRGPAADRADEAARGRRPADPGRAPRRGGARAREHAARRSRSRSRTASTRSSSTCSTSSTGRSCSRTRTTRRGQPRRGGGQRPRALARRAARGRAELPTLDEALAFLAARPTSTLHVDLKLTTRLDEVADALARHGLAERAVVSSFHLESLRAFAARGPAHPDRLHVSRGPVRRLAAAGVPAGDPARHARAAARDRPAHPGA